MSQSRSRQQRRAGARPRGQSGTPNGAPVYEGHMVEVVPAPGGTVAVVVGLGPHGGAPRALTCLCPHAALELADTLRAAAMEHVASCVGHEGP